jgi:hypothetical protein
MIWSTNEPFLRSYRSCPAGNGRIQAAKNEWAGTEAQILLALFSFEALNTLQAIERLL